MQKALTLYLGGNLRAALQEAGERLRDRPHDSKLRTFLFELLCFAGEWDRAEKHLDVLAVQSASAASGVVLLRGLLQAHRSREQIYAGPSIPTAEEPDCYTTLVNDRSFQCCADEDARVVEGLETYGPAGYQILPWVKIQQLQIVTPTTLRDLLWLPGRLLRRDEDETQLVYLPALAPGSWRHTDDLVRLGRLSVVEETTDHGPLPFGSKLLMCDGEAISLLDVRSIEVIH